MICRFLPLDLRRARRAGVVLAVAVWSLAVPSVAPVRAQPAQEDQREANARQLFAVGKYAEALEIFGKLYAETTHPTYLRNIGRCYQNLGDPDRAIASFREYLRQARGVSDDQRRLIEGYIGEMEELKRKQASVAPKPEEPAAAVPAVPAEAGPTTVVAPVAPPAPPAPDDHRPPTAAYVVGGASVAALAIGAVFGVLAIGNKSDYEPNCPMGICNEEGRKANEAAVRDARISDVALGAGIIGAGVATYLYLTSRPPRASEPTAARRVRPTLGAGTAGLGLEARW